MKITIDSDGNVSLDTTYDPTGIDIIQSKMNGILDQIKTFNPSQIELMCDCLNSIYPEMVNFEQLLNEWEIVLGKVVL